MTIGVDRHEQEADIENRIDIDLANSLVVALHTKGMRTDAGIIKQHIEAIVGDRGVRRKDCAGSKQYERESFHHEGAPS